MTTPRHLAVYVANTGPTKKRWEIEFNGAHESRSSRLRVCTMSSCGIAFFKNSMTICVPSLQRKTDLPVRYLTTSGATWRRS